MQTQYKNQRIGIITTKSMWNIKTKSRGNIKTNLVFIIPFGFFNHAIVDGASYLGTHPDRNGVRQDLDPSLLVWSTDRKGRAQNWHPDRKGRAQVLGPPFSVITATSLV